MGALYYNIIDVYKTRALCCSNKYVSSYTNAFANASKLANGTCSAVLSIIFVPIVVIVLRRRGLT